MRNLVCVAVIALLGCDQGKKSADAECGAATASLIEAYRTPDATPPADIKQTLTNRCVEDRWSAEARECLKRARTSDGVRECRYEHLTQKQAEKLTDASRDLGPSAAGAMRMMRAFKDKMCKCTNAKCAQDVSDEMTKWSQEMSKNQKEPPRMTEEDTKQAAAIGEEMGKCMQRAMSADTPADPMSTPN